MKRLLLIPLLAAACAAPPPVQTPPPAAPVASGGLEGPLWRLSSIGDNPVEGRTVMMFRDGKISGQGPCNALRGNYERVGDGFSIDAILSTKKACARLDEENRMLDSMLLAQNATVEGDRLTIASTRAPALTFQRTTQ